jgi:C-terminal processing protease CtpA/Prc
MALSRPHSHAHRRAHHQPGRTYRPFFETATGTKFVGSPTQGANADVTNLSLPGGIYVHFSGQGVWHADGRQLQRLGLQPDVEAHPTLAGIRAGKDEVLDKALEYVTQTLKAQPKN